MIRPAAFGHNAQTAGSNAFQSDAPLNAETIQRLAAAEFDGVVAALRNAGVNVVVFNDTPDPPKPDAVFPNNWVSFHPDGTVILYPMFSENRRAERRMDVIDSLSADFEIKEIVDLSGYETEKRILEGTGSIVFDHEAKIGYACVSPRTDPGLLSVVCERLGYEPFCFHADDRTGKPIYHTNVMMCIAERFAVLCLESISDKVEQAMLTDSLVRSGRRLIEISFDQMYNFVGNMLAIRNGVGRELLILSQRAHKCLTVEQREAIAGYCGMLPLAIDTIETIGGGSSRCMIAEVFLNKRRKM